MKNGSLKVFMDAQFLQNSSQFILHRASYGSAGSSEPTCGWMEFCRAALQKCNTKRNEGAPTMHVWLCSGDELYTVRLFWELPLQEDCRVSCKALYFVVLDSSFSAAQFAHLTRISLPAMHAGAGILHQPNFANCFWGKGEKWYPLEAGPKCQWWQFHSLCDICHIPLVEHFELHLWPF